MHDLVLSPLKSLCKVAYAYTNVHTYVAGYFVCYSPALALALAVIACRHQKMRVDKRKFVTASGVSQVVFQSVLDKMQSCIPTSSRKEGKAACTSNLLAVILPFHMCDL